MNEAHRQEVFLAHFVVNEVLMKLLAMQVMVACYLALRFQQSDFIRINMVIAEKILMTTIDYNLANHVYMEI